VKAERRDFFEWLMNDGLQRNLVYMDETGFNVWTARTRGRARRGEAAVRIVEGQRGRNLTVILAVSPTLGLVHHAIHERTVRADSIGDFVSELEELLASEEPHILLCDNAPAHTNIDDGVNAPNVVRRLPRYSPFLNLTELANADLKAQVKQRMANPQIQAALSDRQQAANVGLTLHQQRMLGRLFISTEFEFCGAKSKKACLS
jgi:hypothetical protein